MSWQSLLNQTRRALAENLTSALNVGGDALDDVGGRVRKLDKTTLHTQTKITRSTITKLAQGSASGGKGSQLQATPTLDTLCRLAWALKVPPAFLLMSNADWKRLARAIIALDRAGIDSMSTKELKGNDRVVAGLDLAEKLGIYPIKMAAPSSSYEGFDQDFRVTPEIKEDIKFRNEYARLAILNTTSITQRGAEEEGERNLLTALGAIFGAMGDPDKQGDDK